MGEREGTPEDFAAMLAESRGHITAQRSATGQASEQEQPPDQDQDREADQLLVSRLFGPKPGDAELVRRLHGSEEP